ncbi:MAG: MMPL family transporter [Microthrixaceae bacterium]
MFTRIGSFAVRRRGWVMALSGLFVLVAAVLGTGVFGRLDAGGFSDPSSESALAAEAVADEFDSGQPNVVLLVDASDGDVDSAASSGAAAEVLSVVAADPDVAEVVSYWSLGSVAPLRSSDGTTGLVLARVTGDENAQLEATERLLEELASLPAPTAAAVDVAAAGPMPANAAVTTTIEGDLARAESIAVPVTLLLLVLVFAGLVAAGLPLMIGGLAVLGTFFTLYVITLVTDVSIFSINLVTALGLGLAIDYSLFIVSRFREELARRPRSEWNRADRQLLDAAVVRTVETAGRTVAFSGLTVAVSLSALLVFPMYFLRSFAYAGIGVTLVAVAASMFTLPAALALLGRRVDAGRIPGTGRRVPASAIDPTRGFWYRTAMFAQRHAVAVSAAVVAVLVLLGLPFLSVSFGVPDERVLPEDDPARVATERLRSDFDTSEADGLPVVLRDGPGGEGGAVGRLGEGTSTPMRQLSPPPVESSGWMHRPVATSTVRGSRPATSRWSGSASTARPGSTWCPR